MATVLLSTPLLAQQAVAAGKVGGGGGGGEGGGGDILPFNSKFVAAPKEKKKKAEKEKEEEEEEKGMHPTTVFLTGLVNWGGGEEEIKTLFETHLPGSSVHAGTLGGRVGGWVGGWWVSGWVGGEEKIKALSLRRSCPAAPCTQVGGMGGWEGLGWLFDLRVPHPPIYLPTHPPT